MNMKRRHNARINPTADIITQGKSHHPRLIKDMLRRVGFNELLDFVRRDYSSLPEPSWLIVSFDLPNAAWRFI